MSTAVCSHCGCSEIDIDQARGDAVCTNCGSVLEDQIIVSEVQFQESAGGSSSVIGQFVSSDGIKSHTLGSSFQQGFNKESRAITLQNAKRKIQHVGAQLRLNQHCIDTAFNFFKIAVNKRLTRGRKTMHVVAACVYLVCRTEGTPHMLLDLSDVLQVNVYSLGKTYLQLSRELCINIPAIDPCLYIPRFAHKLEFEDKTHEVSMTAMRLVQRMKRDWMHTGRRPSGLCGAALLVAARIHDFSRKMKDIIKVVRVCETTIRKRLNEFGNTASSQLTIDEFQRIDLEEEHDPPAFLAAKKKAKQAQFEDNSKLNDLTSEVSCLQKEIEENLEKTQRKPTGPWAAYAKTSEEQVLDEIVSDEKVGGNIDDLDACRGLCGEMTVSQTDSGYSTDMSNLSRHETQNTQLSKPRSDSPDLSGKVEKDPEVLRLEEEELNRVVECMTPMDCLGGLGGGGPGPTAASIGIKESVEECMRDDSAKQECEEDGELDLTGIDDEELDRWILGEAEVKVKTEIWMRANADYLQEQKVKEEREAKEREENANKPEKKKRKTRKKQPIQANTAKEAIEQMLQQKKISNKINYDVLKDLNRTDIKPSNVTKPLDPPAASPAARRPSMSEARPGLSPYSRFRKPSISLDAKTEIKEDTEEPVSKKAKVEESVPRVHSEVLVETGPVQYGEAPVEEEEEEEEYEGEEEPISAAQLFGNTGYDEEAEYYDMDDME